MATPTPEKQLASFIAKFTPEMAALIRASRKKMLGRLPYATEFVYDNYNFFVIGYGPGERPSEAVFSLAADAHGLRLCFLQGADLPDPRGLLRGSGSTVRNLLLPSAETLDRADIAALMKAAGERAKAPFDPAATHRLVIRSVSAKQRPRRAAAKPASRAAGAPGTKRTPKRTAVAAGAKPARAKAAARRTAKPRAAKPSAGARRSR